MNRTTLYDTAARHWDQTIRPTGYAAAYADFLQGQTSPHGPVLDAGSGTGSFALAWLTHGGSPDITLLDQSQQILARAKDNLTTCGVVPKIVCADLMHHQPACACQTILAAHVVEQCNDPQTGLQRLAEWLAPNGRMFLVI